MIPTQQQKKFNFSWSSPVKCLFFAVMLIVGSSQLLVAQSSIVYDFNTANKLSSLFNVDGSGQYSVTKETTDGLSNSGSISVPLSSTDAVYISKDVYTFGPEGHSYVFESFTNSEGNSGNNGATFTTTSIQTGVPVVITSSYASSSNAVTVNGNVTSENGSTVTERGIVYGTAAAPTLSNNKIASGAGTGTFSAVTPTLSPGTYFFRAYATNSSGTSYGAELTTNICSPNLPTIQFKLSPPDITTSAIQGQPGIRTENFNTQATGQIPDSGTVANGTYTKTGNPLRLVRIEPNAVWGGTNSPYLSLQTDAILNITLTDPSRYLGFWWGGGDEYNRVTIFGSCGGNEIQLGQFTTSSVTSLLAGATVTAVDGNSYPSSSYRRANAFNQPFAFINLELSDPNVYFTRMEVTQLGGGSFEIDNITSGTVYGAATYTTPSAMTISSITAGGVLTVNFNAPSSNGGQPITNFEYSTNGGTNWVAASPVVTTSPLVISGLSSGTTYSVLIRAVNNIGYGPQSSAVNATPISVSASSLTIDPIANQTYTGSALTPAVVVKESGTTLTLGTDYSVAYSDNTIVGTATVTITGMGNYTGTKSTTFTIVAKAASSLTIDAITNQTYTGSALTPAVVVKDGATTLTEGTHYTVAYTDNTDVGTATVTITGRGNYTGRKTQTFVIVAKAASTLTIDAIANQTYTGAAIIPLAVVKDGSTTLTLGTDYSVACSNNTNVGTATLIITGIGNYTGTKAQTFVIVAKAASTLTIDAIANQTFTGSALTPAIVVKDGATTLTLGTHYSVAYSNNTNVGTATVTITGLGNYTGTKTETFGISMWTARTSAADNSWISVTYGNGLFVAIAGSGTGNRVMTSSDGITWTARTSAADLGWFSVTYGNGLFVAVATTGTGNRVMTSPDGINWTSRLSATDNTWYSVTYGNGLFVAVAGSGAGTDPGNQVMTSPDGITWTSRTSAADNNWYDVTYGNGLFVAVAATGAGNRVMTSPDGITWTARTSAADNIWSSVTYGNGLFVAVASSGTGNRVMTSPDGITWTARTSAADNYWWGITYGNGLFVAVSFSGTGNRVMTSPDGITWTAQTPAADNNWYGVTYGNGLFVAVANTGTGNRVMTLNAVVSRLTIDAIANQTFTGSALTPTIVVKDDATTLTLGTHYSVAYSNNTNVGTATVTITGTGNYTGTKTQTFTIVAKAASTLAIDAIANQTYTGSAITPTAVVKDGATTLTLGTDYSVAYSNNTNVGTATVTITGTGNYTGTKTQTFSIVAKAASTLTIDAIANQTYTGAAITPTVVVKDGANTLILGTNYTVAYSSNTNLGTATVTITGTGNYTGTKTQTFSIVAKAASTLTIDPITNQTYTGSAITPTVVVKDGSTKLALGTDYTIAYSSNTNVGTATVTITGTGNYTGTKTQTFGIVAKAASTLTIDAIANQTYTGSAITPTVVVKDGSTTLTLGTDYTVAYSSNTNVGTATVTITGTGNYSGDNSQTFNILPKVVTLRANNASKIYGDANPSLSFSYSGLVAGDTEIDQVPTISTAASTTSGVGNYSITLTGGSDPNYSLTLVEGVLEVSPAPLSLTVNAVTKIYGQADPVYTYSLLGLKGSDTEAVLGGASSREAGEDPGTYRISQGSLSAGANYTLTVTGASLQILKAKVSSVAQLALVTTAWSKEAALPATVKVLAAHGQDFQVEVKWDKSTLNLLARGTYSLTGRLQVPAGIENPNQVLAKILVQVLPKPAPRDVTITNDTFTGSTKAFFIPVGDFVVNDPVDKVHVVSLLGDGYDNTYFQIKDNILFWSSAERAAGKTSFSIVVRVTDRDGNTLDKFFEIKRTRPDFSSVTIFNTFTPNGDRFNDTWGVPEVRFYEGVRISVYERGGTRLFYTENPDIRWDGTYNGKEMPVGSYYWVIEIGEIGETRRGVLNLIGNSTMY